MGKLAPEMLVASFNAHWPEFGNTLSKLTLEHTSKWSSLIAASTAASASSAIGSPAHLDFTCDAQGAPMFGEMIMHQLLLRGLEMSTGRAPTPTFQLDRYSRETLLQLRQSLMDLQGFVHEELS